MRNNYTPGDLLSTEGLGLKNMYKGFRVAGDSGVGLLLDGIFLLHFRIFYIRISFLLLFFVGFYEDTVYYSIPIIIALVKYMTYFNNSTGIFRSLNLILRNGIQRHFIVCDIIWQ